MKKIIGILGISLIMAVSFFNMSSVVDTNQNVDLASIIQNANADPEWGSGYASKEETNYIWGDTEYFPSLDLLCVMEGTEHTVSCYGDGNLNCTPEVTILDKRATSCRPW